MKKNNKALLNLILCLCITLLNCNRSVDTKNRDLAKQKHLHLSGRVCYFTNYKYSDLKRDFDIKPPAIKEADEIDSIVNYIGLPVRFKVFQGELDNALATVADNQRIIIYGKNLLDGLDDDEKSSGYWCSMFILSHEIGHHLAGHFSGRNVLDIQAELEADEFAGASLYRLGATFQQAITAINDNGALSQMSDSQGHPDRTRRIAAIKKGYYEASQQYLFHSAIPPIPQAPMDSVKTEFNPEDFKDSVMLTNIKQYAKVPQYYEGIIINSRVNMTHIGFSDNPMVPVNLAIQITKGDLTKFSRTGDRGLFSVPQDTLLGRFEQEDFQNYPIILARGNKIGFKFYTKNGSNFLYYIKYIPRNTHDQ